jgi:uncharacterized membrane protein YoaK (UPF0700 family)
MDAQRPAEAPLPDDGIERVASQLGNSALLALAGGFLDGFTYLGHGHVFANAMTGNVVLLALGCVSGMFEGGLRHLPPILMFLLGVTVARALQTPSIARRLRRPHLAALLIQIGTLVALALLPQRTADVWFTMSIAFAASVQVESFRRVNGRSFNSTFTTGNLRTFAEGAFVWLIADVGEDARGATLDFGVICLAFFSGAAAGGVATMHFGNSALWIDVVLLGLIAVRVHTRPS